MTDELVKRLRGLRVDGTPVDVTMGQAADEIERLTRDMAALQSQWDDMQQGFVEVFGEPVRDAIELLGATERLRSAHEPLQQRWVERSPEESDRMLAAAFEQGASRDASSIPTDAKDSDPVPPCDHPPSWIRRDGGPWCGRCGATLRTGVQP